MAIRSQQTRCFTLLEVLAVMAIIMVLAGLVLGIASAVSRTSSEAKTKARMEAMMMALQEHFQDRGYYPQQATAGDVSFTLAAFTHSQTGRPYLAGYGGGTYRDGWDQPFQYSTADAGGTSWSEGYHLWSNGSDKTAGTADDINSWGKR